LVTVAACTILTERAHARIDYCFNREVLIPNTIPTVAIRGHFKSISIRNPFVIKANAILNLRSSAIAYHAKISTDAV